MRDKPLQDIRARRARNAMAALLLMFILALGSAAQEDITASRRNAIVRAIEKVGPTVCSINVIQVETERPLDPFYREFWDFFDLPRPRARLRGRQIDSIGSGFLFDRQGHILTNYHVLEDADLVTSVTLSGGRELAVDYVGGDRRSDVAVLKAKGENLPSATLGSSDDLLIGEWVIAIGNPFGSLMTDAQPTVSVGIVSANHRRVSRQIGGGDRLYQDMIQTDAAINPGNSGGPLINALGEVVGVNTLIFSEGGGSEGLGFALPINRVRRVAQEIIQHGRRRDPWPGFMAEDIRALRGDMVQRLGVQSAQGCLVIDILEQSPAYQAGLRLGDVITAVNGQSVTHPSEIDFAFWGLFVGDKVALTVDRQGAPLTISFAVVELKSS